jgi:tetratricopeptide (TPR) repeat protein
MGGIFINYRGDDSDTAAMLIDRELAARFGSDRVFLDNRSIPAGVDFVAELLRRLRTCSVLVVVIGPRWLTVTNAAGQRRLDDPADWVRFEITEALNRGLRVIPVLTGDAVLPTEADLPLDIAGLGRRQYVPLRRRYTDVDLTYLVKRITEADTELAQAATRHRSSTGSVPRQLVAPPRLFTGRKDQLAALTRNLDERGEAGATVVISAIGGAGGIGKTALALYWAYQHVERFPDGQLYVNLRGFDPSGEPLRAEVAVRGFLDALGVDPAAIPVDLDAQAALYRGQLAGKRMLVVLDNVHSTEQVEPLLPGSPTCTVLITSRRRLTGLITRHGAQSLGLDMLTQAEARELFTRHVGVDRVAAAEPEAVTELLSWCAGLPLAVSIVAARAAQHPNFPLALLAEELREESARLNALEGGEPSASLRAVFSWSYHALAGEQAEVFGLLALAPGPDISLPAAASLTALSIPRARVVLGRLEDASLVQQPVPGRWRMHDLVRLYATEQAHHDQPEDSREAGLRRLVEYYTHTAYTGDRALDRHRTPITISSPVSGCHPGSVEDDTSALAWFDTEHACLLAAQDLAIEHGWYTLVWQLAWALHTFHWRRGHLRGQVISWQAGLVAAEQLSDTAIRILTYRLLGSAYARVGSHEEAFGHLRHALMMAEHAGDVLSQAHTHRALARAWEQRKDNQQALHHATHALRLYQTLNTPLWEANALDLVGWYQARLGRYQQARTHCADALALYRKHYDRDGEATALDSLGYIAHHTTQHAQALDYYHQALTLFRDRNTYHEANTLNHLGHTHAALGDHDQARHSWQQALQLYQVQHRTADIIRVQQQLDELSKLDSRQLDRR